MSQTMTDSTYDINDIKNAYRKLKSYIYYDNFFVYLREKIAQFESSDDFENKFEALLNYLNNPDENGNYINTLFKQISSHIIPKRYKNLKSDEEDFVISNDFFQDQYEIEKVNYLINAPVEIHIISVLWILEEGYILAHDFSKHNYAYSLEIDHNTNRVVDGLRMFKPYFEQYQKWRDNAINSAQQFLNEDTDVLIIGLDIKEYFYNIKFNDTKRQKLVDAIQLKKIKKHENSIFLTNIIFKINGVYAKCLPQDKKASSIPIGLLSSGILANWFLKDLDRQIIDNLSPSYYGRYVDDIVLVLSNATIPSATTTGEVKSPIARVLKKFFEDRKIFTSKSPKVHLKNNETSYCWRSNENIQIQKSKVSVHSFNSRESKAILEKFKKNIQKNSSAFWLLPNENQINDDFDESVYELSYTDTINKLRSISEIKQSKYGASVFLAKKIKISLLSDNQKDEKTTDQILTFFKGRMNLEFSSIWEKVLTYFLITNDQKSFCFFVKETIKCIDKITYQNVDELDEIKKSQILFLINSISLAVSLNPNFLGYLKETLDVVKLNWYPHNIYKDIEIRVFTYRKTNLLRHSYIVHPLMNFINTDSDKYMDFVKYDISNYKHHVFDLMKLEYSPRFIYLYEFTHYYSFQKIVSLTENTLKSENGNQVLIKDLFLISEENFTNNVVLDKSFETFFEANYLLRNPQKYTDEKIKVEKFKKLKRRYFNSIEKENRHEKIIYDYLEVSNSNLKNSVKIAVANIKVEQENLQKSFFGAPNTSKERRKEFLSILNDAERNKVDFLILPEVSVPHRWSPLLADESRRKDRVIIAGLEHITINRVCYNFTITLLPMNVSGIKDTILVLRLKNHYSPHEESVIKNSGKIVPRSNPSTYNKFIWNKIHFSVYNCYELADITHRTIFRSEVDLLFASEYNRDINYFSNIVDTVTRDVHCYFIQANSSDFGDSRITRPSRTETKDILRLKGGTNNVILCAELDLKSLRSFQSTRIPGQNVMRFKNTPPDYDHDKAEKRLKGL
ncbi:hypothetical protein GR160_17780 [Flavobacterium sp. Sd200]|uniref:RNA-directed DNA polymerase n=1 Tax=Flavobacterium sp. Sd200 TaxID=2692211 RepID=UPI00136862AD|nr:RNA-directed DNA polymerase [Flavobacterium sp. Sd200]MXN93080.1 hypothetical protein [Flavobacterium sp. Sd200]